ncbi:MAG: DUF1272 domain-containing protein [Thermoplasmata archaeon]|nr:DUF1272 domain-containing protein [Thermoplasmata archaeon]
MPDCERCKAQLAISAEAYLLTFECSFCASCYRDLERRCPNCSGELVRRPRPADLA